jgi:activator of HSP90 ATPase
MTSIHQEVFFDATPERVYEALTDSSQFSRVIGDAPAEISPHAGGTFSCFGGMITGMNVDLEPHRRIVQAWRSSDWTAGVYSIVRIELLQQGQSTLLTLDHAGFPEEAGEHLETGWKAKYWTPLEKFLAPEHKLSA